MDPLTQVLVQRQMVQQPQQQPQLPVTPPNLPSRIPPEAQRFANAQKIQDAYRGGWQTNPVLLQAALGHQ